MSENTDLPALPAWQARSFWLTIVGALAALGPVLGFDVLAYLGVESEAVLVDNVMEIVAAVAIIWAWVERRAPNYRLTLKSQTPTHPDGA